MKQTIAHIRKSDGTIQTLEVHLEETAALCSSFSETVGLPKCGRLLGLLHDKGKYSSEFQKYIRDITGSARGWTLGCPSRPSHGGRGLKHFVLCLPASTPVAPRTGGAD